MAHAAYAAELVGKLCAPRQVEPAVFDWLAAFLRLLDGDGASAERLRVFEIGLLSRAGVRPGARHLRGLRRRASPADRRSEVAFRWDPDRGGAVCALCARGGRPHRGGGSRGAGAGCRARRSPTRPPSALPADVNRDCREALLEIISHHVSGPLKSVEFIAKVAAPEGTS